MKRERDHQFECGICGAEDRYLLHNVRHRTPSYRRLCTNCLLKDHRGLFCPFCFSVYEEPLPNDRSMCNKCPSISHKPCIPSNYPHHTPFICPSCSSPNFSFFNPTRNGDSPSGRIIDRDSARALVAAAKIAAVSMTKAAAMAKVEAEKRVKEATFAKKRAREALEGLAYLAAKEKEIIEGKGGSNYNGLYLSPPQITGKTWVSLIRKTIFFSRIAHVQL
ncbi:zinc finger protein [Salix suchowensis]|nr:zinc finger protein [Salix suchowensis]